MIKQSKLDLDYINEKKFFFYQNNIDLDIF
jgi:hypothetical protein